MASETEKQVPARGGQIDLVVSKATAVACVCVCVVKALPEETEGLAGKVQASRDTFP